MKPITMDKYIMLLSLLLAGTGCSSQNMPPVVEWKKLAVLQNPDGGPSLGFAGAVNGVHNGVLVTAGGANFPWKMPWEGGKKRYSDEIHVLQKRGEKYVWNQQVSKKLPEPIAYCGSTSTEKGIVYAGGENENGISDKAYLIRWDGAKERVEVKNLPDLPLALTNIALTNIGNVIYAAGGDTEKASSAQFLSLNLGSENPSWKTLPDLPKALAYAAAAAQQGPGGTNIYVIGGRTKSSFGISGLNNTVFIFDPRTKTWQEGAPVSDGKEVMNFSAGTAVPVKDNLVMVLGGDNGEVFHQIETYLAEIAASQSVEEKSRLAEEKNKLVIHHQGFYRGILVYNTLTNTWSKAGELPFPAQVTTTAVLWDGAIILSNGEVKPGIRTPNIMCGTIQ